MREGSVLCLDYPAGDGGREAETNRALAHGAGETMKASYGAGEMKTLLRGCGFEVLESLELRDVILEIADDLYSGCKMSEYGSYRDETWLSKYVYCTYAPKR